MSLILIGVGGALGSLSRYKLGQWIARRTTADFPVPTLLVNLLGALLLGAVNGLGVRDRLGLFLADGFLGAFTTFSTFMVEGFRLFQDKRRLNAAVYVAGTTILGVLGYLAGLVVARAVSMSQ